jgi:small basic protein
MSVKFQKYHSVWYTCKLGEPIGCLDRAPGCLGWLVERSLAPSVLINVFVTVLTSIVLIGESSGQSASSSPIIVMGCRLFIR